MPPAGNGNRALWELVGSQEGVWAVRLWRCRGTPIARWRPPPVLAEGGSTVRLLLLDHSL